MPKELPVVPIKKLADLPDWDPAGTGAVPSGFPELDRVLGGGFRPGEVTVWTGANSSGKSTLLGQVILEAVEDGQAVCSYSGELPDRVFRYWLELQAAGPDNLEVITDRKGARMYNPRAQVVPILRTWYRDLLYLYDSSEVARSTDLLTGFNQAAEQYGCKVFLLDNLTMIVSQLNARDQYRAQRELILAMVRFAREQSIHVHIVAHPKKTAASELTKADIGGSGDITNLVDNVIALARPSINRKKPRTGDACLKVLKNRFGGRQDIEIWLGFDLPSRRFYPAGGKAADRCFGWNDPENAGCGVRQLEERGAKNAQ